MLACHAGGPGSIPGRCKSFFSFHITDYPKNPTWKGIVDQDTKLIASSGNRTRAARVAGEHSTTEPTMLSCCLQCAHPMHIWLNWAATRKYSRSVGFEPTPAERNWFLVSRLNHSATTAFCLGSNLAHIQLYFCGGQVNYAGSLSKVPPEVLWCNG